MVSAATAFHCVRRPCRYLKTALSSLDNVNNPSLVSLKIAALFSPRYWRASSASSLDMVAAEEDAIVGDLCVGAASIAGDGVRVRDDEAAE